MRGDCAAAVSDLSQLALWMAGSLAGIVSAMLLARAAFFQSLLRRLGAAGSTYQAPSADESLPRLAEAIIGSSKSAIAAVFGFPRGVADGECVVTGEQTRGLWDANTWYYPLTRFEYMAMSIEFDDDSASNVEFFLPPQI